MSESQRTRAEPPTRVEWKRAAGAHDHAKDAFVNLLDAVPGMGWTEKYVLDERGFDKMAFDTALYIIQRELKKHEAWLDATEEEAIRNA